MENSRPKSVVKPLEQRLVKLSSTIQLKGELSFWPKRLIYRPYGLKLMHSSLTSNYTDFYP